MHSVGGSCAPVIMTRISSCAVGKWKKKASLAATNYQVSINRNMSCYKYAIKSD